MNATTHRAVLERVPSDAELLARAAAGDQQSWDAIVERYRGLVWSVARRYRLSAEDREDAVQQTWLRLVEWIDGIRNPDAVGAWLASTIRHECLHAVRRGSRGGIAVDLDDRNCPADPAPSLDAGLLAAEQGAALWAAVDRLPARPAGILRGLHDGTTSYAQLAADLEMPIGSIGPTRQRALDRLRAQFSDDALFDPAVA